MVLGNSEVLSNRSFIESLKLRDFSFDPAEMQARYATHSKCSERYPWNLDPLAMGKCRNACCCMEKASEETMTR